MSERVRDDKMKMPEEVMPREMQLDLLVDGELPEEQRRALLLRLNSEQGGAWRELAVRFLQRQTEKETVRRLVAGGSVVPRELVAGVGPRAAVVGRIGRRLNWTLATAAGLLIAVVSAMITFYAVSPSSAKPGTEFQASIPAAVVSFDRDVPVTVPVVNRKDAPNLFDSEADPRTAKRSWVIQPDGRGRAVLIPVNTMKAAIY